MLFQNVFSRFTRNVLWRVIIKANISAHSAIVDIQQSTGHLGPEVLLPSVTLLSVWSDVDKDITKTKKNQQYDTNMKIVHKTLKVGNGMWCKILVLKRIKLKLMDIQAIEPFGSMIHFNMT